ncbi:AfsR/SARP family transcriptional regulator [Microbispora rosea]|uniref:AfsR/SARP family transcriptional regulator n=1 Tax=Microbispora rosea TaxID=58117 RepID=UPI00378F3A3F
MRIALLGPLEARDDTGAPVEIAGIRLRTLLARLALSPGRPVPAEALIDAVWPDEPPAGAINALQSLVSRLRRALPAGERNRLQSRPAGYLLSLALDETDVGRLEALVAAGRTARDGAGGSEGLALAARRFAEALALWRGEPLADLETAGFAAVAARLIELRLRTIEDLAEVRLDLGDTGDLVSELEELTAAHPFRERLWAARMRALCAAGRPSEALAAFEELRRTLAETLGTDPSPPVRELHLAILRGDLRPASPSPPGTCPRWPRCVAAWTACRSPSSSPARGFARCRSRRSPPGSGTGSGCSPAAAAPRCRATRRFRPWWSGAGTCWVSPSGSWPGASPSSRAAPRPTRPRRCARTRCGCRAKTSSALSRR